MTTAKDIMSKKVVSVEPTVSVNEIAKLMDRNNVSCVVLMQNEEPYGIITERDLLSKVTALNKRSSEIRAEEIMSYPVALVSSFTPSDEIVQKMLEKRIRRVVVVDGHQPVGIITVTDFIKHLNSIVEDYDNYKKDLYQSLIDEYDHWKG
ncbi:MAG: CBS domain-containing protein [Nitrosopumilaceae archaeon]